MTSPIMKSLFNEIILLNRFVGNGSVSQVRCMSRVKLRFTVPPFWQPQKTRTPYAEGLTRENKAFIEEVIHDRYSSPLCTETVVRSQWIAKSVRCGVIARKLGVYPMWMKDGTKLYTTLLQVSDNHVIKYIPQHEMAEKDFRYNRRAKSGKFGALVVGADQMDPTMVTKQYFNVFADSGVLPKKRLSKFFITPNAVLPPGTPLYASHYRPGDFVDITGTSVDRDYQGVMKRWGFKGMPASHGVTKSHRRGGNIGGGGEKGRVWPGTKMPGHMGRMIRTIRGHMIWRVNTKYNVLWVHGPNVPGEVGKYVMIYDSILYKHHQTDEDHRYFPTFFQDEEENVPENLYHEKLHKFANPSIDLADE